MDSYIFFVASLLGGAAFALSGFMLGVRKHLDVMGIFIVAMLTSNGGGAIRDIIVNRPPVVLTDINSFYLVAAVTVIAYIMKIHKCTELERKILFVLSDSIGLVAFSVTGAIVAIESDLNFFGVVVIAFLTATGGGIIRDILVNQVPTVLSSEFYGSVSLIIGSMLFVLHKYGEIDSLSISIIFATGLAIRLTAYFRNWHLPKL